MDEGAVRELPAARAGFRRMPLPSLHAHRRRHRHRPGVPPRSQPCAGRETRGRADRRSLRLPPHVIRSSAADPKLAAELIALNVEVMLAAATPAAKAAQSATTKIAIVMADPGDAVQLGLVASLARPGANITGVTSLAPELATKRLELLKEAFPKTARVAVLWNSAIPPAEVALNELRAAAPVLGVDLLFVEVKLLADLIEGSPDLSGIFAYSGGTCTHWKAPPCHGAN